MAESGGLPGWVEAWVGKVVQVHVHGDPDPLFGVLEDWDRRGVVLRHTEDMVRLTASRVEDVPSDPMMILVTWSAVRYVDVAVNVVGPAVQKDDRRTIGGAGFGVSNVQDAGIDRLQ